MKKVIMISEDRYSRMMDSYDKAIEELENVKQQLSALMASGKVVELLQRGELVQISSVLEEIFAVYTDNRDCSEVIAETPEPVRQLTNWMDNHVKDFPEELGDSVMESLGNYEKQWFVNGFCYAMGIVQVC